MLDEIRDFKEEDLTFFINRYGGMDGKLVISFVSIVKRMFFIMSLMETWFVHNNLSHGRFGMLIELMRQSESGPISPAELARIYGAKSATITGLLDHLERDGLIERVPNPEDRRKINIQLTEAGFAFMDDFLPRHQLMMNRVMKDIPDEDKETIISSLSKMYQGIRDHLHEYHDDSGQPHRDK